MERRSDSLAGRARHRFQTRQHEKADSFGSAHRPFQTLDSGVQLDQQVDRQDRGDGLVLHHRATPRRLSMKIGAAAGASTPGLQARPCQIPRKIAPELRREQADRGEIGDRHREHHGVDESDRLGGREHGGDYQSAEEDDPETCPPLGPFPKQPTPSPLAVISPGDDRLIGEQRDQQGEGRSEPR